MYISMGPSDRQYPTLAEQSNLYRYWICNLSIYSTLSVYSTYHTPSYKSKRFLYVSTVL
jgi:hypothetical protein